MAKGSTKSQVNVDKPNNPYKAVGCRAERKAQAGFSGIGKEEQRDSNFGTEPQGEEVETSWPMLVDCCGYSKTKKESRATQLIAIPHYLFPHRQQRLSATSHQHFLPPRLCATVRAPLLLFLEAPEKLADKQRPGTALQADEIGLAVVDLKAELNALIHVPDPVGVPSFVAGDP